MESQVRRGQQVSGAADGGADREGAGVGVEWGEDEEAREAVQGSAGGEEWTE